MVIAAVLCTLMVVILFLNLTSNERKINVPISRLYDVRSDEFIRTMSHLLGPPLMGGNKIESLLNGDQIFSAMLGAIRTAEKTVCFETYIYWAGKIGHEFAEALAERARSSVIVHVLLDAVGAGRLDRRALDMMREAGVEIRRYHPLRWYTIAKMNNRTHRKLLIVDGKVGFTGGVGIADEWLGNARNPKEWRDSHFKLEGPAVAQMQAAFMDNWLKTGNKVLHGDDYFPALEPKGEVLSQVFTSSAYGGAESVRLMYLLSITCAKKKILLANSYFVPDALVIDTLVDAARRGVEIEIIVPGRRTDVKLVRIASRGTWGKLLKAGIKIYEYQPTMYHCKVMVVDSIWVSVGSTNFDNRSFRLNDEANLNVFDTELASIQEAIFYEDRAKSKEMSLRSWKRRPLKQRIWEMLLSIIRSQL